MASKKGEITRARILEEATRVFYRKGFLATTISDLLQATGATKGNLYFHFAGKEALGIAVLQQEAERFLHFIDEALAVGEPVDALDHFFRMALKHHRDTGFIGGCLFGNTALEASDVAPRFAELVNEVFAAWIERLRPTIEAAQQSGGIRRDLPANELAELVVASLEGAIMQSRLQKDDGPMVRTLNSLRRLLEMPNKDEF
ncbi:MAG: TetR family transcriptional regulator C-terminal domain-containing protein [Desulfuromonadales bacterium]|nr:TetR family transcriptional regulator C-terminal domain-containing protein [Desulfuromonadales bacterium]